MNKKGDQISQEWCDNLKNIEIPSDYGRPLRGGPPPEAFYLYLLAKLLKGISSKEDK